jgi:hypothetical protein
MNAQQSAEPKSALYVELLKQRRDEPRSVNQICSLERRTGRGRGESIDYPPNGFDDLAHNHARRGGICAKHGSYDSLEQKESLRAISVGCCDKTVASGNADTQCVSGALATFVVAGSRRSEGDHPKENPSYDLCR